MQLLSLDSLVGKDLSDYKIVELYLIESSTEGKDWTPLEIIDDEKLADAIVSQCKSDFLMQKRKVPVLTNKKTTFAILKVLSKKITFENEYSRTKKTKAIALQKLTPEERKLFDLPDPNDLPQAD